MQISTVVMAVALGVTAILNSMCPQWPGETTFNLGDTGSPEKVTVAMTGMKADGELQTAQLVRTLADGSNLLRVTYNPMHYSTDEVVSQVIAKLESLPATFWNRRKLRLFLGSLGIQPGLKLLDFAKAHWPETELEVIVSGAPMDGDDLAQATLAKVAVPLSFVPGQVGNWIKEIFTSAQVPDYPHDEDSNDAMRLANNRASQHYPLSGMLSQVRSLALQTAPEAGAYAGIPLVVLWAEKDDQVKRTAIDKLLAAFGATSERVITVPGTTHISFAEHPGKWRKGIEQAHSLLARGHN